VSHDPQILPFVDAEGQPIPMGPALLSFRILPAPDEYGRLMPIVGNGGPALLPFPDESGNLIPFRLDRADRN